METKREDIAPPATLTSREEVRRWANRRVREIEAANSARVYNPTPKYDWEREREARQEVEARCRGLERALASAERKLAAARAKIAATRSGRGRFAKVHTVLEDEILDALGRAPKSSGEVHAAVTASYGDVDQRTIIKVLGQLVKGGRVTRTGTRNSTRYTRSKL